MSSTCTSIISEYLSLGINSAFHVLILFTFLTILFFMLIAPLMTGAFESEIRGEVNKAVEEMLVTLQASDREKVSKIISADIGGGRTVIDLLIAQYSTTSEVVSENNKWVKWTAIEIIGALFICITVVLLVLMYSCTKCTGVADILKENAITFVFIGIVEYLFFTKVAFKYVPAPPSTLVTTLVEAFKKNII